MVFLPIAPKRRRFKSGSAPLLATSLNLLHHYLLPLSLLHSSWGDPVCVTKHNEPIPSWVLVSMLTLVKMLGKVSALMPMTVSLKVSTLTLVKVSALTPMTVSLKVSVLIQMNVLGKTSALMQVRERVLQCQMPEGQEPGKPERESSLDRSL
jgi:hypothetical protein